MTSSTCQASRMAKSPNSASAQSRRAYTLLGGEFPRRSERAGTLLHAHFGNLTEACLRARYFYSLDCLEEVFSETHIHPVASLYIRTRAINLFLLARRIGGRTRLRNLCEMGEPRPPS